MMCHENKIHFQQVQVSNSEQHEEMIQHVCARRIPLVGFEALTQIRYVVRAEGHMKEKMTGSNVFFVAFQSCHRPHKCLR